MVRVLSVAVAAMSAALCAISSARADCRLNMVAELPLDPNRDVPVAEGEINGQPARFLIDTGSSWTLIVREEAVKRHLNLARVTGVTVYGVGGQREAFGATVSSLKVGNLVATNVAMIASGPARGSSDVAVILGEDAMSEFDIEFDMANHFVRFFKPQGCSPDQLVYWNKPYSQASLLDTDRDSPSIRMPVMLNGKPVAAVLASGASVSFVDETAANRAGAKLDTKADRETMRGLGALPLTLTTGRFATFALGDESIRNVRIWVTAFTNQLNRSDATGYLQHSVNNDPTRNMMVGADFLKAHRVMVANREHMMVFSYIGGAVFALPTRESQTSAAAEPTNMTGVAP